MTVKCFTPSDLPISDEDREAKLREIAERNAGIYMPTDAGEEKVEELEVPYEDPDGPRDYGYEPDPILDDPLRVPEPINPPTLFVEGPCGIRLSSEDPELVVIDIHEGLQGEDVLTYQCECGETHDSTVFRIR